MREGPFFGVRRIDLGDSAKIGADIGFGVPQIKESENTIIAKFDLPGVNKEDFQVKINEDSIQLKVAKKVDREVKKEGFYKRESFSKSFFRSYSLPSKVDPNEVVAEFKDGILKVGMKKVKSAK